MMLLNCSGPERDEVGSEGSGSGAQSDYTITFDGIVQYKDIEGGVWTIKTKKGKVYTPMNHPAEYKQEGLSVQVWANRLDKQANAQMVGVPVSIEYIERR